MELSNVITKDVIDKIDCFFIKYGIKKDCCDINENIQVISEEDCVGKYSDMANYAGKYDRLSGNIILVGSKIETRLFIHEYMHKKSAKKRFLRPSLLGVDYNKHMHYLNEAITEKITCEILAIPEDEEYRNRYSCMFIGLKELCTVIEWKTIVQAYFNNDYGIFRAIFGHDLKTLGMGFNVLYCTCPIYCDSNEDGPNEYNYRNAFTLIQHIVTTCRDK